jgi:acyl-CoA reductase-like NAD-dependent aldehyde dehydrogenase
LDSNDFLSDFNALEGSVPDPACAIGVMDAICPFNYPVALAVGMIAPALVAGNAVLAKWSPSAGLPGSILAEIFTSGALPAANSNSSCGAASGRPHKVP